MALFPCPECRKEISSRANACPNCGLPISGDIKLIAPGSPGRQVAQPPPVAVPPEPSNLQAPASASPPNTTADSSNTTKPAFTTHAIRQLWWACPIAILLVVVTATILFEYTKSGVSVPRHLAPLTESSWVLTKSDYTFGDGKSLDRMFDQSLREGSVWTFYTDGVMKAGEVADNGRYGVDLLELPTTFDWYFDGDHLVLVDDYDGVITKHQFVVEFGVGNEMQLKKTDGEVAVVMRRTPRMPGMSRNGPTILLHGLWLSPYFAITLSHYLSRKYLTRKLYVVATCWTLNVVICAVSLFFTFCLDGYFGGEITNAWYLSFALLVIFGVSALMLCVIGPVNAYLAVVRPTVSVMQQT